MCIAGMVPLLDQEQFNFIKIARTILADLTQPEDIKTLAFVLLRDAVAVYGYEKVNKLYYGDSSSQDNGDLIEELISFCDHHKLGNHAIRALLGFIFYYKKEFHEAFVYLLSRLFTPGDDEKIRYLLIYFFINFCHVSREHQCIMGTVCVDVLLKIASGDLEASDAKVDVQEMINFVVQVTSFSVLHSDAFDREVQFWFCQLRNEIFFSWALPIFTLLQEFY